MTKLKQPVISVIKIGGNVIDNEENLELFLKSFAGFPGRKILVHGGGKLATKLSEKLEIPAKMIDGRRVTDAQTIDVVTMVYAGLINKKITARLQSMGCNALGLSGADAGLIKAVKRNPEPIDFGFVGDIPSDGVYSIQLSNFLDFGLVPVFCPITADKNGTLLNCNADTIARSIAVSLSPENCVRLIYCFEKNGLLSDMNDENSVIPSINSENCAKLRNDGIITAGMIPKIDNAFGALNGGVDEVVIKSSFHLPDNGKGTSIRLK